MTAWRSPVALAPLPQSAPASRPPRIAVIGCGDWGRNLVRNFAELGALEALVDADAARAAALQSRHGGRILDVDAALADPVVQAVAIAAPAIRHHALAKRALLAGKHVFVEKPLALSVAEGEELCVLAERLDRRLMVGHLLQHHPAFLALRDLVRAGRLGRLHRVTSSRRNLGKIRREEDVLWSLAPHDLSMVLALMGAEPDSVTGNAQRVLHDRIADVASLHLGFPDGGQAQVDVSWLHPQKEQTLVAVGTEAMAVFDDLQPWDRKLLLFPHRIAWSGGAPAAVRAEAEPVPVAAAEPLREECAHFLDCVATGATPRTDGREGLGVLRVLARASAALSAPAAASPPPAAPRVAGEHPGATIHESAYVDAGARIGPGSKVWHFSHILGAVSIGRDCSIGQNVVIGPDVSIGDGVKIQNNVSVYQGVTLEDGVFCGPSCVFTNVNNPRAEIVRKSEYRPTLVKRGATIGANATIVCGHTLGEYSFIAAGAVVTGDVPAFALMAGVPARRIGWMSRAGGRLGADLVCPLTGTRHRAAGPDAIEEIT